MDLTTNAKKIISQADKWTFAGDCSLLQWMEEIAESLEQRATTTNQTLGQLSSNLKRTTTALDNVTNSLAALQYTQFVESRCHDDDETIANVAEVPVDLDNNAQAPENTSELWKDFMKKNFEVLHNCHERYSLDFEDSDDEDTTNNFIYQAKNPYNERLLPHIYGTNLWKENWHVGLCDANNEYSGDEISEAFSESSSITSPEENESSESTAPDLSEWPSSTSITNEKQPHLKIQNASSLRGSQPLFPEETLQRVNKIATASDTSSSTSRSTLNKTKTEFEQNQPRYDLFAPIQDIPPTSSSSSSSLYQQFSSSAQSKTNTSKDFLNANTDQSPTLGASTQSVRRRPVNLFDDDDFNNFMTEIVDKVNQKEEPEPPVPAARKQSSISSVIKSKEQEFNTPINLFAEQSSNSTTLDQETPKQIPVIEKEEPPKKKTLNLFDDNIDLFLPKTDISVTKTPQFDVKNNKHTRITAKSLFDDDEDDDFLNIFASKKAITSKPIENNLLFNDDDQKHGELGFRKTESNVSKTNFMKVPPLKTVDIFKDTAQLFNDTEVVQETDSDFDKGASHIRGNNEIPQYISNEQNRNIHEENENHITDVQSLTAKPQKQDVFSELGENQNIAAEKPIKDILVDKVGINTSKKSLLLEEKVNLFDDDDESDDDIFGKSVKVKTPLTPKNDNLFSDATNDLNLKSSEVKTTEESEKNNSTIFNEVNTFTTIEQVFLDKQDINDEEKLINSNQRIISKEFKKLEDESSIDSKQPLTFKEFKNVEDERSKALASSGLTEQEPSYSTDDTSLNKSPIALADNFEQPENLKKDLNILEHSGKMRETAQPVLDEEVREAAQPLVDEVGETAQPVDGDKVREIAQPLNNKNVSETEQLPNYENNSEGIGIISHIENKTPNTYAGLFLDEPPDDDDAFFQSLDNSALSTSKFSHELEADFYDPALPKLPTEVTNTSKSTIVTPTYSSVGLFSDIPPDDDLEVFSFIKTGTNSKEITKRIHSVFYDDFNETIAAVNKRTTEVSPNVHAIFNDEPPPDNDDDFATLLQNSSTRNIDKNNDIVNDKENSISQDVLDKAKPSSTIDLSENVLENVKVKINSNMPKLQMPKININVQALLPPSAKKTTIQEATDSQIAGKENQTKINNSFTLPSSLASNTSGSSKNILVNVCKNRVRAPVKRRPSTRRARQEGYQKSLIAEQDEKDNEDGGEIFTKQKLDNLKGEEQTGNVQWQEEILKGTDTPETSNSFLAISNDYNKSTSEITIATKTLDSNLFKHDTSFPSEPIEKSTNVDNISKGLHDDFESVEDKAFLSREIHQNKSKLTTPRKKASKNLLDSKPTKSNIKNETAETMKRGGNIGESEIPKIAEDKDPQKSLFFDDYDNQTADSLIFDVSKKAAHKKIPSKSLFADENESDSDELFGTKTLLQSKNIKVSGPKAANSIAKATSLFSSEDDDDDKGIVKFEKSLKKTVTTKTLLTKSVGKADNKVLFSDTDDDDDNLFGKKSDTKATVSKTNIGHVTPTKNHLSSKQEPTAPKSTISTTNTTDNPLADLLNN